MPISSPPYEMPVGPRKIGPRGSTSWPARRAPTVLGTRAKQVLFWLAAGMSKEEIGKVLNVSPLTVKNHIANILLYYKVANRIQAVMAGIIREDISMEQVLTYHKEYVLPGNTAKRP